MNVPRAALPLLLVPCLGAGWLVSIAAHSQEAAPPPPDTAPVEAAPAPVQLAPAEELEALKPFLETEQGAVDAIRNFDKAQSALAEAANGRIADAQTEEEAMKLQEEVRYRNGLVRSAYETGLAHYPANAQLHNYYGEALYDKLGEHDAALRAWHKAIGLNDKLSNPYNNIGLHKFHTGDYKGGLDYMDLALKLDNKNPDYLYNMVQLYLIHGPQVAQLRQWEKPRVYREAMRMSREILKLQPGDFHLTQDYATNFYKAEEFGVEADWKEAAEAWAKARKLTDRQDLVFFTWLNEARTWLRAKQFEQAAACAQEALKLMPESPAAKTVLERAQEGMQAS